MKASEIKLTYRRKSTGIKITSSKDIDRLLRSYWDVHTIDYYESFVVVYLSRSNEVLGIHKIADGSLDACLVDIRKIMQGALLSNSASIILAHNHPSGNLKPSNQDIKLTSEIKKAGEILKIQVLDHLIITSVSYLSLADEGII
ncbi:MAG: JAB domain-containing protein [Saprospiraceae bacterium]|nr:JAB domain-containing protein [Saprospiraceae bacterium]